LRQGRPTALAAKILAMMTEIIPGDFDARYRVDREDDRLGGGGGHRRCIPISHTQQRLNQRRAKT
jgi:hypothetical protein